MGKASRRKAEKRMMKPSERQVLKDLIRESAPEVFGNDKGQITYYNPLKRLLKTKGYKSDEGNEITKEMVKKYNQFLKKKLEEKNEQIKEANKEVEDSDKEAQENK